MITLKEAHLLAVSKCLKGKGIARNLSLEIDARRGDTCLDDSRKNEYFKEFFKWVLTGKTEKPAILGELSPASIPFTTEYKDRNMAYGPRILSQIEHVCDVIRNDSNTRQAYIAILEKEDKLALEAKDIIVEYPCTLGYLFHIEDGDLCITSVMRSNNMLTVFPLDAYIAISLLKIVAAKLGLNYYKYYHVALNAHVYEKDYDKARELLAKGYHANY